MFSGQIWAALSGSLTALLVGLSFGWPSHALPKLQSKTESPVANFTNADGSLLISTGFFCGIFAFPLASFSFNKYGRKTTLLLAAIPYSIGWLVLSHLSHSKLFIFIGKGFLGFSDSIVFVTIPFYLSEIASDKIRGGISSLFSIMYNIGTLLSCCIGPFLPFSVFPYVPLLFILVFVFTFIFMPETPHYYILKNNVQSAEIALSYLRSKSTTNLHEELKLIKVNVNEDLLEQPSILLLFVNYVNRKAFLIVCSLVTIEQFSGITVILFYCQKLFEKSDSPFSPQISAIIFATVFLIGALTSAFTVDKFGRKMLAIVSCSGCAGSLALQTIYFYTKVNDPSNYILVKYNWLLLSLIIPYVFFAVIGLVNIPMILMGELFPAKFKATGSVAFGVYLSIAIMIVTKFFQYMSDEIATYVPFMVFTVNCLLGILFVIYYMPETKHKSLITIQHELLGNRIKAEKFSQQMQSLA